jgi:hypothetical protein
MSEKMKRGTYFQWQGVERIPLPDQETVGIDLGDGRYAELHYRRSDGEISLDISGGLLSVMPMAANCARIRIEK